jgi:hypothetical protein
MNPYQKALQHSLTQHNDQKPFIKGQLFLTYTRLSVNFVLRKGLKDKSIDSSFPAGGFNSGRTNCN